MALESKGEAPSRYDLARAVTTAINLPITRCPEAVVGVLEFWGNAGTGGAAGYFDVVAPGSTAGRLALALFRAPRIPVRRDPVIARVIPVAAPFVDVLANIVEAEGVGGVARNRLRAGLPARGVIGKRPRRIVAPGEIFLFQAAACGMFPFSFRGQAVGSASL